MKRYNVSLKFQLVEEPAAALAYHRTLNRAPLVAEYIRDAFEQTNPQVEQFWVILLNRKNAPMGRTMVTSGTATSALAHPREVFRAAILASATAVICVHNHPSGDPAPSAADLQITRQLREAAKCIEIDLLDHIIIGEASSDPYGRGFYSFREAGLI